MDSHAVFIEHLRVRGKHGVFAEERAQEQDFILDVRIETDFTASLASDNLEETVDYTAIAERCRSIVSENSFQLIERLADALVESILSLPRVHRVALTIRKPAALKNGLGGVFLDRVKTRARHTAYLALGSNVGNREANLARALAALPPTIHCVKVSPVYETKPLYLENQPAFLNAVCQVETESEPEELLARAKLIERVMGRTGSVRNGPRVIDIDILFYDDTILDTPLLTLPHPRMEERAFVLAPLNDIAPNLVHPVSKKRIVDLFAALGDTKSLAKKTPFVL